MAIRLVVAMLGLAAPGAVALTGVLPIAVALLTLGASAVAFVVYARDKAAARADGRRTPERTLHLLAVVGGWPGGLAAQQLLRHKSRKPAFQRVFWLTVLVNVAAVAWLATT